MNIAGADPEILKKGRSMSATTVGQQKKKDFRWSKKAEISFWQNIVNQYFQIFSIFINKILSIFQNLLTR